MPSSPRLALRAHQASRCSTDFRLRTLLTNVPHARLRTTVLQAAPEVDGPPGRLDECPVFYSIRSMDRRVFLQSGFAAAGVTLLGGRRLMDNPATPLVVYKSPTCGCCAKWVDHAKAAGFAVEVHDVEDVNVIKKKHGVPDELASCHT